MMGEVVTDEHDARLAGKDPFFRAIAVDFDGTLTEGGRPSNGVLDALQEVRASEMRVLLVTGRAVTDLLRVFPDAERHFDSIVAENGAVIRASGVSRALTAPVPVELDGPLVSQGVHFQRGQVLLACSSEDELAVLREVRRLGADCQLIRNRDALMLLPIEVSKGTGLIAALESLGVSHHNTIGIGDAENDLALLRQCELGVAVANAIPSLKHVADIVLEGRAGDGVAWFLRNQVLAGIQLPTSARWRATLGRSAQGTRVTVPASRVNLMIVGGSGVGKSYAAGLLAERLIDLDYSVCILDPEGDHSPLGRLRGVVSVGGHGTVPPPQALGPLLSSGLGSLVVDLSLIHERDRQSYMADALRAFDEERSRSGLPHWIFVDEAHIPFGNQAEAFGHLEHRKGLCLVTYDAGELLRSTTIGLDYIVAVSGPDGIDPSVMAELAVLLPARASLPEKTGEVLLIEADDPPRSQVLTLDRRFIQHVRHWHKYITSHLPSGSTFHFRSIRGPTGAHAENLSAFRRELLLCDLSVVQHHAANRDFSRWLDQAIQDKALAKDVRDLEDRAEVGSSFEDLRRGIVEAVENRYLG